MGKYSSVLSDVFSIFATPAWTAENIKTYPNNFVAVIPTKEFIRVNVIANGTSINNISISGILIIEIYTSAGEGPKRSSAIADKLDDYLQTKSKSTVTKKVTQFLRSSIAIKGVDKDNPSLHRVDYTIPFNYFGVV